MGTTTWLPLPTADQPRQWLLASGDVVTEPKLEQTSTGRKVRIAGTEISAYAKDIDELTLDAVERLAKRHRTSIWLPLHLTAENVTRTAGFNPEATKAELYLLKKPTNATTRVWWRFKHPTLPIEAMLHVTARRVHPYVADSEHAVSTALVAPLQHRGKSLTPFYVQEQDGFLSKEVDALGGQARTTAQEFIRDNPPTAWDPKDLLGRETFDDERHMVDALLAKVRACDDIESIQIPDLRNPDKPAWLTLQLHETNINSNFMSDLTEYLEGTPTVKEALRLYNELRECIRGIGVVLDERTESDFQRGLIGDDPEGVTVNLGRPHTEAGADSEHRLRMHLPTGTFIVDCSVNFDLSKMTANAEMVAERWDEARTVASLSGEEDTLLAFARGVSRQEHSKRARKIIRARKGDARSIAS